MRLITENKKVSITTFLIVLVTLMAVQGCSSSPSSPAMSATPVVVNSPSAFICTPAPSPESETATNSTVSTTEYAEPTPEPTIPPGIWMVDENYGEDSQYGGRTSGTLTEYETGDMEYLSYEEIEFVEEMRRKKAIVIGGYSYYFDTTKYQTGEYYDGCSYRPDFPLYRKDASGNVEFLNTYGFKFSIVDNYIYISGEYKDIFNSYETFRINIGGSESVWVGTSLILTVPTAGKYLYFINEYDYNGMLLYRSDKGMEKVEKLRLVVPDWDEVAKKAEYSYTLISIYNVDKSSIYFTLTVQDIDVTTRYIGKYKVNLDGSVIEKVDKGKYYPPLQ